MFVSVCQPSDELATSPRVNPPSPTVSWNWLQHEWIFVRAAESHCTRAKKSHEAQKPKAADPCSGLRCPQQLNSGGQSTQLHYLSRSKDTPGWILLQYKWKLLSQIITWVKVLAIYLHTYIHTPYIYMASIFLLNLHLSEKLKWCYQKYMTCYWSQVV